MKRNTCLPGALIGFALLYGPSLALAQTAPPLGEAGSFAVLGASTVTNTGPTIVTGDLGLSPGTAVTGFPPGTLVGGSIHAADALAAQAQNDATTAYNDLADQACTTTYGPVTDVGGMTLLPGVYCFESSAAVTGTLTLNAQGNPNAVFVFKTGSTFITASGASVLVINGGQNCNVFWQVGSSATLGTTSTVRGTIIALASITLNTGATLSGRAIARTAAVTLDSNAVGGCAAGPVAETIVTGAGGGLFPPDTTFNGVPIVGLEFGYGVNIASTTLGQFSTVLLGPVVGGVQQRIIITGEATSGQRTAANVAVLSGTVTVDLGGGAPPTPGVPFTATVTIDANDQGSLGLVIGATSLPSAAVNEGSMTIRTPAAPPTP
jgi:hypothetical protein